MAIGIGTFSSAFSSAQQTVQSQSNQATINGFFSGQASTDNILATTAASFQTNSTSNNQIIINGLQKSIDQTLGYRTNLDVAEKQKLADLQGKIADIEARQKTRLLTSDEIKQRATLFIAAYKLLGKQYTDISHDTFVKGKLDELTTLLETKPKGEQAARLKKLQNLQKDLQNQATATGAYGVDTRSLELLSISRQIGDLTPPRKISQLSITERNQYDRIVTQINDHVGNEYQLPSAKKLKIERLQATIDVLKSGGVNTFA